MQISTILKSKGCVLSDEDLEVRSEECKAFVEAYCHTPATEEMNFIISDMILSILDNEKKNQEGALSGMTQGDTSLSFQAVAPKSTDEVLVLVAPRLNRFRKFSK